MKEWLTADEIADEALPHLPNTKRGVNKFVDANAWNTHPTYARKRQARGGGMEYHFRLLPTLAQVAYVQKHMTVGALPMPQTFDPQAPLVQGRPGVERDARLAVLAAFELFERGLRLNRQGCLAVFCDKYEMGSIKVEDWVKQTIPTVSRRSLMRWMSIKRLGRTEALAVDRSKARAGTGVLDTANGGKVKAFILSLIAHAPQLSAAQVKDQVEDEFGPQLKVVSKGVEWSVNLPPPRTFQHFLKGLKERHTVELTKLTNPDKFRSTMALSGTGTLRHITEPNALWQIDASPVDALCVDGRHAIYACIDIATRRTIWYVSRTPRASAVALLIRKAILAWGAPDTIKTDNGSDFVAQDTKRLFASTGITMELSDAYSPQQKGHVERVIKTFQHQFASLLPGYVGHSVAERKTIEDRKSFADRLGQDTAEAFGVSLTGAELQLAIDQWTETMYAHAPHGGLKGMTPFQAAAASTAPIRTIDERALDVLLMPVAGSNGRRRATKFGLRIDHYHYIAASILPGTDVFVRRDPNDMGRVHAFSPDQGSYLGEAICPELSGVHPETWLKAQKELRSEIIAEKTAEIRKGIREIMKGPALHERALRNAARKVPNVIALPKREERHETPEIRAALQVGKTPEPASFSGAQKDLHETIVAELTAPAGNVTPLRNGPTPAQRFRSALAIEARIQAHEPVESEETLWLLSYRDSAEYKVQRTMFEEFGDQAPGLHS
ncbi:DDE-type integrase/transposase/recombinase [Rhizobium arsenicireducens]